ncbi:MAG: hypothetical protein EXS02_14920 [Planctomycetes bacterium]|nr:hypothetical protein [Planctomycetota bacterium]
MGSRHGRVSTSSWARYCVASAAVLPHISGFGRRSKQNCGRSGWPNRAQKFASVRWTQRLPAGLPFGIPRNGVVIDGAMQQAPQPTRQSKVTGRVPPAPAPSNRRLRPRSFACRAEAGTR